MKKLIYLTSTRLPTEKVRGYQICKMCEVFSNLSDWQVELHAPRLANSIKKDIFSHYSIKKNFDIFYHSTISFHFLDKLSAKTSYILREVFFASILFGSYLFRQRCNKIIFTRDFFIASLFKKSGYFTVYEAHAIPQHLASLYFFLLKKCDKIVVNSIGTGAEFIKRGFKNILVAPNGVDLEEFKHDLNKDELRKKINLPLNKKIICYSGHFYSWKNISVILEAAKIFSQDNNIIFYLLGGLDNDIIKLKEKLALACLTNVIVAGRKSHQEVPDYLQAADLLLLTVDAKSAEGQYYTSPIKLFEYLASKTPVLAADVTSLRNLVSEKEVFFFQVFNISDLINKIKGILSGEISLEDKINQGYKLAEQNTWQQRADKIIKFINNG